MAPRPALARSRRPRFAMPTAALVAIVALLGPLVAAQPAYAAAPAALTIDKTASSTDLTPGQTFNYSIEVGCSFQTDRCVNAVLTDSIPTQFTVGAPGTINVSGGVPTNISVVGQLVTVQFRSPLAQPVGEFGHPGGNVFVTIPLTVRTDLPYTPTAITVPNTASVVADNAAAVDSTANVNVTVPLQLRTTASKSFAPSTVLGAPGSPTAVTVGGTNTSNSPVDTFTIQDPELPEAAAGIFAETLRVQSLDAVVWPEGATSAIVSVWDASVPGWVDGPSVEAPGALDLPPVVLADIRGVRIAFSSGGAVAIPTGATASFDLETVLRQSGSGPRQNTSISTVAIGTETATDTETRALTLEAATSSVEAGKQIVPPRIATVAFEGNYATSAVVTLTGSNSGSVPLKSLSISEPADPSDLTSVNPLAPGQDGGGLIFVSMGSVVWPSGATSATVTYYYAAATPSAGTTGFGNPLPAPADTVPAPGAARVTGFTVTFSGESIPPSATATIPFTVRSNLEQVAPFLRVDYSNTASVAGVDVFDVPVNPDTATDTIAVFADQIAVSTVKSVTRSELSSVPGQSTTATLRTTIADYPESTRRVSTISMFDPPADELGLTEWYQNFDATQLTLTNVPSGATLTVLYRDSAGNYVILPGFENLPPGTQTIPIPEGARDSIRGLELRWQATSPSPGFVPGQSLTANVEYTLRSTLRDTAEPIPNTTRELVNCTSAVATTGGTNALTAVAVPECATADLKGTTGGGPGGGGPGNISVAKSFLELAAVNDQELINTRSSAQTRVRLTWSTGGLTGVDRFTVTDSALTPWPALKGMYDAFDLVRINEITPSLDPQLQYDTVYVELFNKDLPTPGWETPAGWTCTALAPCETFLARTLSTAERDRYVGVRFIFEERDGRVELNPAPGSGVSSLSGGRNIDLVFQIRDTLRSDPGIPVVSGYRYNADLNVVNLNSVVRNDVAALAVPATGVALTATANDAIELRDPELALETTKTWTGGPLPIPATTDITRPTSRVVLTTRNNTVGGIVSTMSITEPSPAAPPPGDTSFRTFDLNRFFEASHPLGATALEITVRNGSGTQILSATGTPAAAFSDAQAWTASQLDTAESFTLNYSGRMATNAQATVTVDLTLRATVRGTSNPVQASTVFNSVQGTVADLRFVSDPDNPTFAPSSLSDSNGASIELVSSSIEVAPLKAFLTTQQLEPLRSHITLRLQATPGGSERVQTLMLLDDQATFWNAFHLINKGSIVLPEFSSPGGDAVLQVEACTGGSFVADDIRVSPALGCEARSGNWSGVDIWLTQANLDANQFLTLPFGRTAADVTGLRLTVKRAETAGVSAQWENPEAPMVTINLTVQRRENLRSGGAVPTDYALNTPAPGEEDPGLTTNGLIARVDGVWGGTATDSTEATYRYQHRTTSVRVQKLPSGVRSPGVEIPYTLEIRNTGQSPIIEPIITDFLPRDADGGGLLIFNPDAPTNYTFALTGSLTPPIGDPTRLPTGVNPPQATVMPTVDSEGRPTRLRFTFPSGTVLGVGQTYTINVPLFFRPGLVQGVAVTNSFEVRSNRLLNACTAPSGFPATFSSERFGCTTSTTVRPTLSPAVRAFISVKAREYSSPEFTFPDNEFTGGTQIECVDAALDEDGFSRPPCAPTTIPGQEHVWRNTIQNTGTTPLTRLVIATRLPTTGDQTIVSDLVRNSRWLSQFTGEIETSFVAGTVTTYYTTAVLPCDLVLRNPNNPAICGPDPANGWAVLSSGLLSDAAFAATVTGLQFIVVFPADNLFDPAETATIDITARTVAQLDVFDGIVGSTPLAANSLSVSGISSNGGTLTPISALDYSRAEVGLATGSVVIEKSITGDATGFVPDGQVFTGDLVCTSLGEQFVRPWSITVDDVSSPDPETTTITNIPGGASCTVTETNASGQTTFTANPVIIRPLASPTALPIIEIVNDYQFAGLLIRKSVDAGPSVLVVPTQFEFEVSCVFLSEVVPLDPDDANFTLDDGESKVIGGIPANATCTVTETNNRGADRTIVNASTDLDSDQGSLVTEDNDARTAVFNRLSPAELSGEPINQVEFNNRFDAAALVTLQKLFAGGAAAIDQFGERETFDVNLRCTFENSVPYDDAVALSRSRNGFSVSIEGILSGSECTVSETDLNGADAAVITVDGVETNTFIVPEASTPVPSPVVAVAVTNWFLTGSLTVTKAFDGDDGAIDKFVRDVVPAVEFTVQLVCTRGRVELELPGGNERVVTETDRVATYTEIASGSTCVLTETDAGGAISWQVLDAAGDPVVDDGVNGRFGLEVVVPTDLDDLDPSDQPQPPLTVENTFRFAEVSVAKVLSPNPQEEGWGPFDFALECTLDDRPIEAAEDAVQTVGARESFKWTELAEGAECAITETDTGGAVRVDNSLMMANGRQGDSVIGTTVDLAPLRGLSDEPNQATFINWYALPNTGASSASVATLAAIGGLILLIGAGLLGTVALRRKRRLAVEAG